MSNQHAQIVSLARQRIAPAEISKRLGVHRDTIYASIRKARREGEDIPHFRALAPTSGTAIDSAPAPRQIAVPVRLFSLLEREAERLELTPSEAARHLLEQALLKTVTA